MYTQDNFGINRSIPYKMQDTFRSFGSSAKQAFKDFSKLNTPGSDIRSYLGITPSTPRPTSILNSVTKLPGGASSALRLPSLSGSSGGSGGSAAPVVSAPELDYYNAALAGHYGMDASTAYQEALANTSYQRSVKDMIDAGLNPASLFAAGRVSGANGVSYATQLGSGFVDSGSGSGSARGKHVFSKGLYNALQVVGGGLAVAVTKHPASYFPGAAAAKGVLQAINGFFR